MIRFSDFHFIVQEIYEFETVFYQEWRDIQHPFLQFVIWKEIISCLIYLLFECLVFLSVDLKEFLAQSFQLEIYLSPGVLDVLL